MSIQSELAQEAKCFCFNDATERAVVVYLLLSKTGLLNMTPSQLAIAAKAYSYDLDTWKKIVAYLLAVDAGLQGDTPKQLADAAKCYCFDEGTWKKVVAFLLASGGSGGPCPQDMQIAWTPGNLKLGELLGFSTLGNGPNLVGITTLTPGQSTLVSLSISAAPNLTTVSGPSVTSAGTIGFTNDDALVSFSLPLLATVAHDFTIGFANALTTVSLPSLTSVGGGFSVFNAPLLTTLTINNLATVATTLDVDTNAILTSLDLSALVTAGGLAIETNPALTTVNLSSYVPTNGIDQSLDGNALTVATVDAFLARCVANAAYVSGTINISGGTNAAPSSIGPGSDYDTLINRGVIIQKN